MEDFKVSRINFLVVIFLMAWPHVKSQNFQLEINNIKSDEDLAKYWINIKDIDQSKRGLASSDSIDNVNYKKVILLVEKFGYPINSIIPNLVAIHQRSLYVNEYYFPIYYNAYKSGKADTFWFYQQLRGIHRGRFGRDYIRGRKLTDKDVDTLMKRLSPYLNSTLDFSILKFDSLYSKYIADLNKITTSELIHKWKNKENDMYCFYRYNNKLFYHKVYSDGSGGWPQEIKFNELENRYEYIYVIHKDYFKIDANNDLQIFVDDKIVGTELIVQ